MTRALSEANLPSKGARQLCGVGGTARAVLKIANTLLERPQGERQLTAEELSQTSELLLSRSRAARDLILKACPDRLHTILPGVVLMQSVCTAQGGREIFISPYGVREGYLYHRLLKR